MYLSDLLSLIDDVPGGAGLVYWEPAHICVNGGPGSSWENLSFFDFEGEALPTLAFARMQETSVEPGNEHGELPFLLPADPNPFRAGTTLTCVLPEEGDTLSLSIYDVSGRLVRTLVDAGWREGVTREFWDGRDAGGRPVATGVYFCEAVLGQRRETTRLVLLR